MNAPYPPALLKAEAQRAEPAPTEPWDIRPDAVRLSSRPLNWRYLNIERREVEPGSHDLPGGTTHHLIFVSLADGHCIRSSNDELIETEFEAGHVSLHPALTPVRWQWDMRLSFAMLCLEAGFLGRIAEEVFDIPASELRLRSVERQRDPLVTQIAGLLSREALHSDPASALLAESMAMQLAVHLIRHYSERPQPVVAEQSPLPPRPVLLASEFIHDNYSRDISLADIAQAAHLSPFHLARRFKKSTGMTPHQYLVEVRVNSARSLLSAGAGSRSLADVAAAVGFSDQSHLTRHFKRLLGLTPKQLKQ
ncbi:MAG: AraC family transcriptional regulator [Burkholderiales bacterium]